MFNSDTLACSFLHNLIIIVLIFFFSIILQSSAPVELTEAETEYAVSVVKHIFDGHVVLQFNCSNTIPEQLLENVNLPPYPHVNTIWS